MNDIAEFTCPDCGGRTCTSIRFVLKNEDWHCSCGERGCGQEELESHLKPCPTCTNGKVRLEVECDCIKDEIDSDGIPSCTYCEKGNHGYRPMSTGEVKELMKEINLTMIADELKVGRVLGNALFHITLHEGLVTYKGQRVRVSR